MSEPARVSYAEGWCRRPSYYESESLRPACAAQTRSGCSRQRGRPSSALLACGVMAGGMTKGMTRPTHGGLRPRAGSPPSLSSRCNPSPIAHAADQPASAANVAPFTLDASSTTPQDSSNPPVHPGRFTARRDPRALVLRMACENPRWASSGSPALGMALASPSPRHPSPGLDSASPAPPRCDGRGHDRGLRDRRRAGCDRPGHDRGPRHRRADDTNSSYPCASEGHVQSPSVADASSASIAAMIA
jgi:hypothetical protein